MQTRRAIWGLLILCGLGCALPVRETPVPEANSIVIQSNNQEWVWERVVETLHAHHFDIARENKFDGSIQTFYFTGSGVLEPWHRDSVGLGQRLESTLQSIRRRVDAKIQPVENGYLVHFEVYKELEDLEGLAANSAGGASFQNNQALGRDLNLVVGQSTPSGWIALGRDPALERQLLANLQAQVGSR